MLRSTMVICSRGHSGAYLVIVLSISVRFFLMPLIKLREKFSSLKEGAKSFLMRVRRFSGLSLFSSLLKSHSYRACMARVRARWRLDIS